MPLKSRTRRREDEREAARAEETPQAPSNEIQHLLAMQQSAGNQAVAATLQRKVKIGDQKPPMVSHKAKVPAIPDDISAAHDAAALNARIAAAAQALVVHKDLKGEYATTVDFYKAVVKEVVGETAADGAVQARRAGRSSRPPSRPTAPSPRFPGHGSTTRSRRCSRRSCWPARSRSLDSGRSTAAHGNKHGKLPKPIPPDEGKELDTLAPQDQMNKTPYFEFLISGGHKKTHGGIERAIIDIKDDRVWITAHYDKGSLAELVGVPEAWSPPGRRKSPPTS